MIVAIEGVDGTGKSTLASELGSRNNMCVVRCSAPDYLTEVRQAMRKELDKYVQQHFTYYLCVLAMLLRENADDIAKRGAVFDRYLYSTRVTHIAFDRHYNKGANIDQIVRLSEEAEKSVPKPDLVIFLRLDEKTRRERIALRASNNSIDTHSDLIGLFEREFEIEILRLRRLNIPIRIIDSSPPLKEIVSKVESMIGIIRA